MRVICAWCLQEGVPAFLREAEPYDDPTETHGICGRHRFELLQELATVQSAAAAGRGDAIAGRREVLDARGFLNEWITDGHEVLDRLLPTLLAEHSGLRQRMEAAERSSRGLDVRVTALRQQVTELQREQQALSDVHAEVVQLVEQLVGRVARDVMQPLYALLVKHTRPQPPIDF